MTRTGAMHLYVAAVVAAALLLLALLIPSVDPQVAIWVIVAGTVTEAVATNLRDEVRLSLGNVVVLVAMIIGGPPLAIVGVLGSAPVFLARATDQRLLRATFNTAQLAISASATAFVYQVWLFVFQASFPDWRALIGILAAAATYGIVNVALVSGIIVVTAGERFFDAFKTIGPSLAMQIPYSGIAVLAAVVISTTPTTAVLLLAVPALVARQGLLAFQHLDDSYDQLVRTIVDTIEMKDRYTRGHSERVAELSVTIAEELGVTYEERRLTRYAALLHDVGKVGVPLCIINKPGRLDDAEFERMKQHPSIGAEILRDIDFLEPALDIVRFHHERLDGRGYPYGVPGEELSRIVRIVTTADAFDAMTSTRSYRRAMPIDDALAELRRCAGNQFDPDCVEALVVAVERLDWQPLDATHADDCSSAADIPLGTAEERIERANTGQPERTPRQRATADDAARRVR